MTYQAIINDSFTRADTSFGGGAGSTNVGVPDQFFAPSSGDAWIDDQGSTWAITGNALIQSTTIGANGPLVTRLRRKDSEKELNQQIQIVMSLDGTAGTGGTAGSSQTNILLREQFLDGGGTKVGFYCQIILSKIIIGWHNASTLAIIAQQSNAVNATYSPGGNLLTTGRKYIVTFTATSDGAGGTNLSATIQDQITTSVIATVSGNGSTASDSHVHNAGTYGLSFNPSLNARCRFWNITNSFQSATNLLANQPTIQTGSQANEIVLTGIGTSWLSTQPTFALSGAAAVSLVAGSITYQSDTQATLTVNVGAGTGQTLTITDPSQGSLNTCTISIIALSGANPAFGVGLPVPDTATTIKIYCPPPYAGVGPYAVTAWRYRTTTFTSGTGGAVDVTSTLVYDKNGIVITDTPPDAELYLYRVYAVDSAGSPKTGHSAAIPGVRGFQYPGINHTLGANSLTVKIGGIGDSIFNHANAGGTGITPVQAMITFMNANGNGATCSYTNNAFSGASTANFDPTSGASPNYYTSGAAAFVAAGVRYILYRLGTNDSGAAVSKATYKTQVQNFLSAIATDLPLAKVFLSYPDLEIAGDGARNDYVVSYCDALTEIIASGTYPNAYAGSLYTAVWFEGRAGEWADSLHPSDSGAQSYGAYDADNFLTFLQTLAPLPVPGTGAASLRLSMGMGIGI